ncbi:antibiotic biosynthesis monooxygenase family protein [Muricomes intestini]|uniref:antibiotic biosynthesis monooxygenase family protein n=1 Tax=Muricomes intestini TaxID=1796634 RepID=UPI002FE05A5B
MVMYHGVFTVSPGKREEYITEIKKSGLVEVFCKQTGNFFYEVSASIDNVDQIIVCDAWETREDFQNHVDSKEVADWHEIYYKYVIDCAEKEYHF